MRSRESRKVKVTKEITACYHQCPYFELDGGPSPVMHCGHPSLGYWDGFIISHPECDEGFPQYCPLISKNRPPRRPPAIRATAKDVGRFITETEAFVTER